MEQYLTVSETASILRVHVDTVRRWLRSGKLRGVKHGKDYRIPATSVHATGAPRDEDDNPLLKALELQRKLGPIIKAGTKGRTNAAQTIDAMREERLNELCRR